LTGTAALAGPRAVVELGRESCAGPVAVAATDTEGAVVFHNLAAGRYVISLPAETGGLAVAVVDSASGRWLSGRLSGVTDGRRYAVDESGQRIVVALVRDGDIRIQLAGL
jgi:hypothetical protein